MVNRYALLIGNGAYYDPTLQKLDSPREDVLSLAELLLDPKIGAFDEVKSLIDEDDRLIRQEIYRLFHKRTKDDLLLLYFSGHGIKDNKGNLYFAVRDTDRELLRATAIPASFIRDEMDQSGSKRQVLILDCCFSGAFNRGKQGQIVGTSVGTAETFEVSGYGRIVLTATDTFQYALEGNQISGEMRRSVFTHFLVEGLSSGHADQNGDGKIDLDELFDYVSDQVVLATPSQTPCKFVDKQQHKVIIANNPHPMSPKLFKIEQQNAALSTATPNLQNTFSKSWECPICNTPYDNFDDCRECYEQGDVSIITEVSDKICASAGNDPLGIIGDSRWTYVDGYIKHVSPTKCRDKKHYREIVVYLSNYLVVGETKLKNLNMERKFVIQHGNTVNLDDYKQWLCPICKTAYNSLEDAIACYSEGEIKLTLDVNDKIKATLWHRDPLFLSELDNVIYTELYGYVKSIGSVLCQDKKHYREVVFQLTGGVKANDGTEHKIDTERVLKIYSGQEKNIDSYGYWICNRCNSIYDSELEALKCQQQAELVLPFSIGQKIQASSAYDPWNLFSNLDHDIVHFYGHVQNVSNLKFENGKHFKEVKFHVDRAIKVIEDDEVEITPNDLETIAKLFSGDESNFESYKLWTCSICNTTYKTKQEALNCQSQGEISAKLKVGDKWNGSGCLWPGSNYYILAGGHVESLSQTKCENGKHFIEATIRIDFARTEGTGGWIGAKDKAFTKIKIYKDNLI